MVTEPEIEALIKTAVYSRVHGEYKEAVARLEEAVRLDPSSAEAHRYLGQTLSYQAAAIRDDPNLKADLLQRAEALILKAKDLQGGHSPDTLHDLAWVLDEKGHFAEAIDLYHRARALSRERALPSNPGFTYNLACSLAKSGQLEKALEELQSVVNDTWQWAETDPDFESLRKSETSGETFRKLLSQAKAQSATRT